MQISRLWGTCGDLRTASGTFTVRRFTYRIRRARLGQKQAICLAPESGARQRFGSSFDVGNALSEAVSWDDDGPRRQGPHGMDEDEYLMRLCECLGETFVLIAISISQCKGSFA